MTFLHQNQDIALIFPGQGSQHLGMGQDLYQEFAQVRETFAEASDTLGFDMAKLCFTDPDNKLNLTEFTQPAILTLSIAILRIIQQHSPLNFSAVAGHSLGEYSALVSLGTLSFTDALKIVHFRGQAMQRAVPLDTGAMAAYLGTKCDDILELCNKISTPNNVVEVVNFNSLEQLVISGHTAAVEKVCNLIAEQRLGKAKKLAVSAPFHSSLMQPAAEEMALYLQKINLQKFDKYIVANVDGALHSNKSYTKEMLIRQLASPVLWVPSMLTMQKINDNLLFIELGPSKVLAGLVRKTLPHMQCYSTQNCEALRLLLS